MAFKDDLKIIFKDSLLSQSIEIGEKKVYGIFAKGSKDELIDGKKINVEFSYFIGSSEDLENVTAGETVIYDNKKYKITAVSSDAIGNTKLEFSGKVRGKKRVGKELY